MSENVQESLKKMIRKKSSSFGTFITDLSINQNQNIVKKIELEKSYFYMKKHYNDIVLLKEENLIELNRLIEQEKIIENLMIKAKNGFDDNRELIPKENNLLENIDKLGVQEKSLKKLDNLKKKSDEQKGKLQVENEYTNSLLNMIANERSNIKNTIDCYNENKERLRKINLSFRNIGLNLIENSNKSQNLEEINKGMKEEIIRIKNMINSQKDKVGNLSQSLDRQKNEIVNKKQAVKEKFITLEKVINCNKDDFKTRIIEIEKLKIKKLNNENKINRIILGLDLIKRYLIEAEKSNKRDITKYLLECEDYTYFKNAKFSFVIDENLNNSQYRHSASIKEEEMNSKNHLQNLKSKFDKLDIEYDEIYNFYTKILNKQHFVKEYLSLFNNKQINLESKKEKYTRIVHDIMSKNYKNFKEIIKSNSKLKTIKKLDLTEFKQNQSQRTYDFNLMDYNKSFYNKCEKMIQVVNSFLNYISSYIECTNLNQFINQSNIKEVDEKIKSYFKTLSQIEEVDNDKLITHYFEDFQKIKNDDYDKIFKANPNFFQNDEYNKKTSINEDNQLILFAHLNNYYYNNKTQFLSVNLCYEKNIYFSLEKLPLIEKILDLTFNILDSKAFCKLIKEPDESNEEDKKKHSSLNYKVTQIKPIVEHDESYRSNYSNEIIVKKKQANKVDNKMAVFLSKVYYPYIEKHKYLSCLNEGILRIKRNTKKNIVENYQLAKKQDEITKISNELLLYNNPKINLNVLSNNTYNTFVKKIISSQIEHGKKKLIKAKSTENFYKKNLNILKI